MLLSVGRLAYWTRKFARTSVQRKQMEHTLNSDGATQETEVSTGNLSSMFTDAAAQTSSPAPSQPEVSQPSATPATPSNVSSTGAPAVSPQQSAPVASPQQPQAQQPQTQGELAQLIQAAQQFGIQVDGTQTPEALAKSVLARLQQVAPYAAYAQQLVPHDKEIREFLASRNQPQQQAAQATQPANKPEEWTPQNYFSQKWQGGSWKPQYTQAIQSGWVQQDENTGTWVAAPGAEALVMHMLPELNATHQAQQNAWREITLSNPYEHFWSVLQEPIERKAKEIAEQLFSERFQTQQVESAYDAFTNQNASWMYAQDPVTGNYQPTPDGQRLINIVDLLAEMNPQEDPQARLNRALELTGLSTRVQSQSQMPQQQASAPMQAQPAPAQSVIPNVQDPAQANQQAQQSFLDKAVQRATRTPNAGAYPAQDPQNFNVTDGNDLNNMFVSAWKAKGT